MPTTNDANAPAQLLIQSQMLELYTKAAGPIENVRACAWTSQLRPPGSGDDTQPDLHALVLSTHDKFTDYVRADGPYTGWTATQFGGKDKHASHVQAGFYAGVCHVFKLSNHVLYQWDMSATTPSWVRVGTDSVHAYMASSHAGSVYFDQPTGVCAIEPGSPAVRSISGGAGMTNIWTIRLAQISLASRAPTAVLEVTGKVSNKKVTYYLDLTTGDLEAQESGHVHRTDIWSPDGSYRINLSLDLSSNQLTFSSSLGSSHAAGTLASNINRFEAVATSATTVEVFAINSASELVHWVFDGAQNLSDAVALADRVQSFAIQVVGEMLELGVVGATATSSTFRLFRVTRATDGLWRVLPVYYNKADSSADNLQTYPCFRTDVTIGDENGIAVAGAPIYFLPNEDDVEIDINGIVHLVSAADEPLRLVTNAMGRATFTVNTSTLHTPQLLVWTDFTGGRKVLVEPNGPIQTELRTVDAAGLAAAKKQNADGSVGATLLPSGSDTGDLATALNETMALGQSAAEPPGPSDNYLYFAQDTDHVFVADAEDTARFTRLAKASVRDKHFTVRFDGGRVSFERHTRTSAKAAMTRAAATATTFAGNVDDVLQGALEGSLQITAYTISDATSARDLAGSVEAFFEFIVDGINYVVEGIIEFVRQAFAAVESVFASIGVFFSDLFAWLGQLFSWQDILNTQTVIESAVSSALSSVPARIASNANYWQQLVALLSGQSESTEFGDIAPGESANAGIATSNPGRAQDASVNGRGAVSGTPQSNWAMSLLADSQVAPKITPTGSASALIQSFPEISLPTFANQDSAQSVLDTFFDELYDEEGDLTWASVSTAVRNLVTALGVAALSSIGTTILANIEAALAAVQAVLEFEIEVPILTDLYASITNGKKLTILSLVSLVAAIPATIAYKLCSGNVAPFTTDTPVSDLQMTVASATSSYQTSVSAATIFPPNILDGTQAARTATTEREVTGPQAVSWVFGFTYGCCYILAGIIDTWERTTAARPVAPGVPGGDQPLTFNWAGAPISAVMLMAQSISSPWIAPDPYPTDQRLTLYWEQNLVWYYQWVMSGCDAVRLIAQIRGWDATSNGFALSYSILGAGHIGTFIKVAVSDGTNHLPETDLALKTTQNMLTAVGEMASWPYGWFIKRLSTNVPAVAATSAVYSLLFWVAPGVLNIARTALAMQQGIAQVDV